MDTKWTRIQFHVAAQRVNRGSSPLSRTSKEKPPDVKVWWFFLVFIQLFVENGLFAVEKVYKLYSGVLRIVETKYLSWNKNGHENGHEIWLKNVMHRILSERLHNFALLCLEYAYKYLLTLPGHSIPPTSLQSLSGLVGLDKNK